MKSARVSILLLFMLVSILSTIPLCRAQQTIIAHNVFQGRNGKITATAYVYKDVGESVPDKDFYAFKMRVHSDDAFNYAKVSIYCPQGTCDMWEPTQGTKGEGIISFSYFGISFNIWIPNENVWVYDPYTHKITWEVTLTWTTTKDMDFAAGFYAPQGSIFTWTIDVKAEEYISAGRLWGDTATWSAGWYGSPPNQPELYGPYLYIGGQYVLQSKTYVNTEYFFGAYTTDPDGDGVRYVFYWGDGTTDTTGYYSGEEHPMLSHSWSSPGTHTVKVRAYDPSGLWSESQPLTVNIVYSTWTCDYCGATFSYEPSYCPYCYNSFRRLYIMSCINGHYQYVWDSGYNVVSPCPYCGVTSFYTVARYYLCTYCGKWYYQWNGCYHSSFTPS